MTSSMASHCDFKSSLYIHVWMKLAVFTIIKKLIELSPSNYTFIYIYDVIDDVTLISSLPFIFMFERTTRIFTLIPKPMEISLSYTCILETVWQYTQEGKEVYWISPPLHAWKDEEAYPLLEDSITHKGTEIRNLKVIGIAGMMTEAILHSTNRREATERYVGESDVTIWMRILPEKSYWISPGSMKVIVMLYQGQRQWTCSEGRTYNVEGAGRVTREVKKTLNTNNSAKPLDTWHWGFSTASNNSATPWRSCSLTN